MLPVAVSLVRILWMHYITAGMCIPGQWCEQREGANTGIGTTIILFMLVAPIYYASLFAIIRILEKRQHRK